MTRLLARIRGFDGRHWRPVAAAAVLSCAMWLGVSSSGVARESPRASSINLETDGLLRRAGIVPESLAAVGCKAGDAEGVLVRALEYLSTYGTALREAEAAVSSTRSTVDRLHSRIQAGLASKDDEKAYAVAMERLEAELETLVSLRGEFVGTALDGLGGEKRAVIERIQSARASGWELPIEYTVIEQEDARRACLRDALSQSRISAQNGEPCPDDADELIREVRSHPDIVAAAANLENNLAEVMETWVAIVEKK